MDTDKAMDEERVGAAFRSAKRVSHLWMLRNPNAIPKQVQLRARLLNYHSIASLTK